MQRRPGLDKLAQLLMELSVGDHRVGFLVNIIEKAARLSPGHRLQSEPLELGIELGGEHGGVVWAGGHGGGWGWATGTRGGRVKGGGGSQREMAGL